MTDLPEQDYATILDYLDGNLSDEAMIDFELRLSDDPALAEEFEALADMDLLQRAAVVAHPDAGSDQGTGAGGGGGGGGTPIIPLHARPLMKAAAVLLVAALGTWYAWPRELEVTTTVVAISDDDERIFADSLGVATSLVPPEVNRGEPATPDADHETYWNEAAPAQDQLLTDSLAEEARQAKTAFFALPLVVGEDVWAVVLAAHSGKNYAEQIYPANDEREPEPLVTSPRLPAGERHVLPRPPLERADGEVDFHPGFLVPLRAKLMAVYLGLSPAPFTDDQQQQLTALLEELQQTPDDERDPEVAAARLRGWMDAQGLVVIPFELTDPDL